MNWHDFHFLRPWWFLAALPATWIFIQLYRQQSGRSNWLAICDAELLPFLLQDGLSSPQRKSWFGAVTATLLTIIALAGPTWQRLPTPAFRNDSALVIALNLSANMDAADIKPSRIAKARYKIADLLKQRKDGQTALIVYSGDAFTVTPLTNDTATIASQLEALTTDIMPSNGDNPAAAVQKAVALLQQAGVANGHILLITSSAGEHADAAISALAGHQLSVLAVGSAEGAPISQAGGFVKDQAGNILLAKVETDKLQHLAQVGKGVFTPASADDADIDYLSRLFNQVDVKDQDHPHQDDLLLQQWDEKGVWLILLILPWAAFRFRKGLIVFFGFCLLPYAQDSQAFDWQSLWLNDNQRAEQAFKQQQYQQAAEEFSNPQWRAAAHYKSGDFAQAADLWKDAQTADGQYNRGNALAQAGQLAEAVKAYQQALNLNPQHEDAKYNKELVEKRLQEQQKQQQQSADKKDQDKSDKSADQQQKDQQQSADDQQQQDQQQQAQDKLQDQQQSGQQKQDAEKDQKAQQNQQAQQSENAAEKQQPQSSSEGKPADTGDKPESATSAAQNLEQKELDRANEQLLKRIPDEPTGLLKRKFKYQYSQQGASASGH